MNPILEQYNPWNKQLNFRIDRLFYYQHIVELIQRKEIQVFSGIRRCGKTTLMLQCMRYLLDLGVKKEQILFIPCDEPLLGLQDFEDIHKIISEFRKEKEKLYVFLDEVQVIKGWERYLKGRYDSQEPLKFFVSGSTASFFKNDVASLLTGRYFFHKITTCTYVEYLRIAKKGTLKDYLEWGGFPEVILADNHREKLQILQTYLDTIISKDIIKRYRLRNGKTIEKLIKSILAVIGGKISKLKIAQQFAIHPRSVDRYLNTGIDCFLFVEVSFFTQSSRKGRQYLPKIYPCDVGFSRLLTGRTELGRSAEWAVLRKLNEASYWSSDEHEVDFVTRTQAIQVTYTHDVPQREFDGLLAFRKFHKISGVVLAISSTDKTQSLELFLTDNTQNNIITAGGR
ncbi:ATP-binding protein [Candidatus Woesearchaeota archaeon]|nr:ATP-binding protein [Candidatus Woesearchaeota archaeon]